MNETSLPTAASSDESERLRSEIAQLPVEEFEFRGTEMVLHVASRLRTQGARPGLCHRRAIVLDRCGTATEAAGLAAAIPENAAIIALDARGEALSSRILPGGLEDGAIGGCQP